jgi:hypothetical protein
VNGDVRQVQDGQTAEPEDAEKFEIEKILNGFGKSKRLEYLRPPFLSRVRNH